MYSKSKFSFSIIVPFYNSKTFLHRCIASVLSQTFPNWELILVDDCSTDGGAVLCEEYCKQYPDKIHLIKNHDNSGQMLSRQAGAILSKGDYILFLDSDDTLDKNALLTIVKKSLNKSFDLFSFNPNIINVDNITKNFVYLEYKAMGSRSEILQEYLYSKIFGYSCFFAIKRSLAIKSFDLSKKFGYLRYTEDLIFLFNVFSISDSCLQLSDKLYNYYLLNNSASTNASLKKYKDRFESYNYIYGENLDKTCLSDLVIREVLFSLLSYAREIALREPTYSKNILKQIRKSAIFQKFYNFRIIKDKLSKFLLWVLRLRFYCIFVLSVRKYYRKI